jgi:hypothetical protein
MTAFGHFRKSPLAKTLTFLTASLGQKADARMVHSQNRADGQNWPKGDIATESISVFLNVCFEEKKRKFVGFNVALLRLAVGVGSIIWFNVYRNISDTESCFKGGFNCVSDSMRFGGRHCGRHCDDHINGRGGTNPS